MSYTKTDWNIGDVITAEKLNKMEDGIADKGYSVEQSMKDLFVGNVTTESGDPYTVATILLDEPLYSAPDEIEIVIDNITYTVSSKVTTNGGDIAYGGDMDAEGVIDFSEYPFLLIPSLGGGGFDLFTETPKTCTRISTPVSIVSASSEFEVAVKSYSGPFVVHVNDTDGTLDKTFNEIVKEFEYGRMCIVSRDIEQAIIVGIDKSKFEIKVLSIDGSENYAVANFVLYAADSPDEIPEYVSDVVINEVTPVILEAKSVAGENAITYMVLYHDNEDLVKQSEFFGGAIPPEMYKNFILCNNTSGADQSKTRSVSYLHQTHSVMKNMSSPSIRVIDRLTFENNLEFQYGEIVSADGPNFEGYYYIVQ